MSVAGVNGKPFARLEHRSPGRVRARLAKSERAPHVAEQVRSRLEEDPNVRRVDVNSSTGSVLVLGENTERLHSALSNVLTLIEAVGREDVPEAGVEATVDLVRRADEKLRAVTNGRFSLRALVPSLFITLGIRQLLRQGLSVGIIPWYVLVYYGVDSFLKLYPQYAPQQQTTVTVA
jgi:hypothetical protein